MTKKGVGALAYDPMTDKLYIDYPDGTYVPLEAGQTIEVRPKQSRRWLKTEVDLVEDGWALTGLYMPGRIPERLEVRLE